MESEEGAVVERGGGGGGGGSDGGGGAKGIGRGMEGKILTGGGLSLPDCGALAELSAMELELTDAERAELVKRIFEEGPGALDRFVREKAAEESSIAAAVRRFRSLLERQAERVREEAERRAGERLAAERSKLEERAREISKEEEEAEERRRRLREELGELLERALYADPLVKAIASAPPAPPEPETRWRRLARAVRAFLAAVASAIRRFWRWLLMRLGVRRERGRGTRAPSLLVELPSLAGTLEGLEARFEGALLTSPELRRGVEARLAKEAGPLARLRMRLARRLSLRAFGRLAREAFRMRLEELLSRRRREAEEEARELERRAEELRRRRLELEGEYRRREEEATSERERLLREMGRRASEEPERMVRERLAEGLERSGLLSRDGRTGELRVTARLIDRFADIALAAELRNLPQRYSLALGRAPLQLGTYERDRLRTLDEVSRMDIVESLVEARLRHPQSRTLSEEDVRVNRELSGASLHVVLAFDKSSSMEENGRIQAAKRAVLALYKAVKRRDRRNVVDLIGFDTEVRPMDLVQVWESRPGGFTNTGEALRVARELLAPARADLKILYLITDGYPEAYTEGGRAVAGDYERSLAYALSQASELRRLRNTRLVHVLLEPKERIFVEAAERVTAAAGGRLITTDPRRLAADMLADYSEVSGEGVRAGGRARRAAAAGAGG
ncbi:MAG: hypothetical protein QXD84_09575 [Thermoplasmata archaeon]